MQAPAAHPDQLTHLPPAPHCASLVQVQSFEALHAPATPDGHEYELTVALHVGAGFWTQLSVAFPVPAVPVHAPPAHPDHWAQWPLAHWPSLVHQQVDAPGFAPPGCGAPDEQLAPHVGSASAPTQLSAPPAPAAPEHAPLAQLAQAAHLPLAHWLSLVHQHAVFAGLGAPTEQVLAPAAHATTQLSAPPVPAAPVQAPLAQPDQVAHLPLPHWVSFVHQHAVLLALHAPVVHVYGAPPPLHACDVPRGAEPFVQPKRSADPLPVPVP